MTSLTTVEARDGHLIEARRTPRRGDAARPFPPPAQPAFDEFISVHEHRNIGALMGKVKEK